MAVPQFQYANWGANVGNALGDAFVHRTQQNALAQALPGALGGDQNALAALFKTNPQLGAQVQSANLERERLTAADKLKADEQRRGLVRQGLTDAAGMIVNMPEAELPNAWGGIRTNLVTQYPELAPHLPEQYSPQVLATARGLAGVKPAQPKGPTDDITEFEYARANGFGGDFDAWMARKAQQSGGGSPFFQFLPGADGYLVGNARTGQIAPGMVNGQRAIPGALDPRLQGALVTAKEGAKADVERDTKVQERTRSADDALSLLDEAETILTLPSTTGSVGGNLRDQVAGTVGYSTEGAKNTARLKTIGGQLVAKMPRMEGPQSNYDVQLYREMAGQLDDPSVPAATRREALVQIRRLNEKYASQQPADRNGASGGWGDDPEVDALVEKYTRGR